MNMSDKECEEFLNDMKIVLTDMFITRARENINCAFSGATVEYDNLMSEFTALDYIISTHFPQYERIVADDNLKTLKDEIQLTEIADHIGGYRNVSL